MDLPCNLNIKHKHFFRKLFEYDVAIPLSSRLESCLTLFQLGRDNFYHRNSRSRDTV